MRLTTWIFVFPIIILAAGLAVANRGPVTLVLDPFSRAAPALAIEVPFYWVILGAVFVGLILGALGTWGANAAARRELNRLRRLDGTPRQ